MKKWLINLLLGYDFEPILKDYRENKGLKRKLETSEDKVEELEDISKSYQDKFEELRDVVFKNLVKENEELKEKISRMERVELIGGEQMANIRSAYVNKINKCEKLELEIEKLRKINQEMAGKKRGAK